MLTTIPELLVIKNDKFFIKAITKNGNALGTVYLKEHTEEIVIGKKHFNQLCMKGEITGVLVPVAGYTCPMFKALVLKF